jgi:protein N-terminal glutamine amidohydrolase
MPFYCEENIWHLAHARTHGSALFISNLQRTVACFAQKRAKSPASPMVWDYHVVWLDGQGESVTVWDFDSTLPLGVSAPLYFNATLRPVLPAYAPMFRRIPRGEFLSTFKSDRRHMRRADGSFLEPAPPWPCMGEGSNLESFIRMNSDGPGKICELSELLCSDA